MRLRTPTRLIALCSLSALGLAWQHTACLCSWHINLAWVLAARQSLDDGNHWSGRAEAHFRRALELRTSSGAWMGLGYLALLREDPEATETAFQKALDIDRSQPLANLRLARMRLSEGHFDEAAAHYAAVGDAYSLVHLGDILAGSQPRKAQSLYESAIAFQPGIRLPHTQLGKLFRQDGRLDEALIQFKHALEADPGYGWSWYHVASTCLDAGRSQECLAWTRSARGKFPLDAELMTALQKLEVRARQAPPSADLRRQRF